MEHPVQKKKKSMEHQNHNRKYQRRPRPRPYLQDFQLAVLESSWGNSDPKKMVLSTYLTAKDEKSKLSPVIYHPIPQFHASILQWRDSLHTSAAMTPTACGTHFQSPNAYSN